MTDNVDITAGLGTTIAADEIVDATLGTVKVQYVKLMDGTLDGTSKALVGANGLAVLATQSGTWTVQPGNTANTTAWKVDGSAVTQPISATNLSTNIAQMNGVTTTMGNGVSGTGVQRVTIASDSTGQVVLAAGSAVIGHVIADSGSTTAVTQATAANLLASVGGLAASGAAVSGNPVMNGARAATANPTAVTDGQAVSLMADKLGKLVAVGAIRTLKGTQQTSISNSTAETTIVTAVASTFLDLFGLILANTGASTTKVSIRDTTAGTVIAIVEVPTLETRGFMLSVDSAIPQTTVNTNWTAQCGTATTALEVTALYVKNT